jgi:hypothetical protein
MTMDDLDVVDELHEQWAEALEKGTLRTVFRTFAPRGYIRYGILFEFNALMVRYLIQIGPRLGPKVEITVVNPAERITRDQLVFVGVTDQDECHLDLTQVRQQVTKFNIEEISTAELQRIADLATEDPEGFARGLHEPVHSGLMTWSAHVVAGGLPGTRR